VAPLDASAALAELPEYEVEFQFSHFEPIDTTSVDQVGARMSKPFASCGTQSEKCILTFESNGAVIESEGFAPRGSGAESFVHLGLPEGERLQTGDRLVISQEGHELANLAYDGQPRITEPNCNGPSFSGTDASESPTLTVKAEKLTESAFELATISRNGLSFTATFASSPKDRVLYEDVFTEMQLQSTPGRIGRYSSAFNTCPGGAATSIATSLSAGGKSGTSITVPEGTAVTDQATLSGENAATATGKMSYAVYSDSGCKALVVSAGEVDVTGAPVPASVPETLPPGTYYWNASYSGDGSNQASTSGCGSEILMVEGGGSPGGASTGTRSTAGATVASATFSSGVLASTASALPAPVLARSANIATASGQVRVRLPGTKTFVPLSAVTQIPFGSVIDATAGTVAVTTAGPHGRIQTAQFSGGSFILTQAENGLVLAVLTGGDFSVCGRARKASFAGVAQTSKRRASGRHVVRKLWTNAHGSFGTKGRYVAATVRGTEWLTEDLCEGSLVRVTRDRVEVRDLVHHRRIVLRAGRKYLAKAP
jgi:hypothetical protein